MSETSESRIARMRRVVFRIFIPLLLLAMPIVLIVLIALGANFIIDFIIACTLCAASLQILATLTQGSNYVGKRAHLYTLAIIGMLAYSFLWWLPGAMIEFVFLVCIYFYFRKRGAEASAKVFLLVWLIAEILAILSCSLPAEPVVILCILALLVVATLTLALYLYITARKGFSTRFNIPTAFGMMWLSVLLFIFFFVGAKAPWLTWLVLKQDSVSLVMQPRAKLYGPRMAVPTENGLLIHTNLDQRFLFKDGKLQQCGSDFPIGRVNLFICDPDVRSICYFPAYNGMAILDTSTCQVALEPLSPFTYEHIVADDARQYFAVTNDTGEHTAIVKRTAPGKLKKIVELSFEEKKPKTLSFYNGEVLIAAQFKSGFVCGYSYDVEKRQLSRFFRSKEPVSRPTVWPGVIIEKELVVIANPILGRVYTFDRDGNLLYRKNLLPIPLVKQCLYDPSRRLCYLVQDVGFVYVLDPFTGKILRTIFCGFKTKGLHLEKDYLLAVSSAGIFKIDIDKAIGRAR